MKHKKSLYISTKLQEKQIDIEFYVEEFKKYVYCEETFICLKTNLNYEFLQLFYIYDLKYFVDSTIFRKLYVERIVVEPYWMNFS